MPEMSRISYVGEVPGHSRPTDRVLFMQMMGAMWKKWQGLCSHTRTFGSLPCSIDEWRWGVMLSHHRKAQRRAVLKNAMADVNIYEKEVHGRVFDQRVFDNQDSIIEAILERASYVCTQDGVPSGLDE